MTELVFIDTETTGLDVYKHEAYEVAWAINDGPISTLILPHDWQKADLDALKIGGYLEREIHKREHAGWGEIMDLWADLSGNTLVGSNPAFDAAFLTKTFRALQESPPWHHRLINVAEGGMWVFDWDRPKGLGDVAQYLRDMDYSIPEPDHTAAGDVAATRAVYYALREHLAQINYL